MATTRVSPGLLIASFVVLLFKTEAQQFAPSCKFYDDTNLICSPGDKDYTLQRGLVSDNNRTTAITLRGCRITGIGLESFDGLFGLKYLDLSMNKIQSIRLGSLDGARQVTHLNLSHNMISELPLGLFDEKPNLEVLDLSVNKIQIISLGSLDGTHQVTHLNLSHNMISELPLGLFDEKPNLEVLDLKNNKISTLELGIFDPFSKLIHLDLSSNLLLGNNINRYIFDCSRRIHFIDFSRNDMRNSSDLLLHAFEQLDFINLDRCSLTEVPKFVTNPNLKTMKHLMLSTNQILKIDDPNTFTKLEDLEILNLVYNAIETLDNNVFKPLKKLRMLLLRGNKLKHLPDTVFQNLQKLNNLDLSHNFIEFVPVNAFRGASSLKNLNLSDNRFTYLTDNFCLELKNSGTRLIKFYFNQNPWQCACLKDVLNEVKSLKIEYNNLKYDGTEPVCVTTSEFNCKRHQNFNEVYTEMYFNKVTMYL